MIMQRHISIYLQDWLKEVRRQPLVLRGARQVGKTWAVRNFAELTGRELFEINFEYTPEYERYFTEEHNPHRIIENLELVFARTIHADKALLFLDEIQAAPKVIPLLRWFAEKYAELPVITAGSLLEFVLKEHTFSMPVGRISFAHMEPLSFAEYLRAHGQEAIIAKLKSYQIGERFSTALYDTCIRWFQRYQMVGGMPQIVAADVDGAKAQELRRMQRNLIQTFRDDFGKYGNPINSKTMNAVLLSIAASVGRKFVYAHVGEGIKQYSAKNALELLGLARLCHFIVHSDANGLALGGEVNEKKRKVILLDVGLLHALWNTPALTEFPKQSELSAKVRSAVDEQILGQQLRSIVDDASIEPQLYYWQREGGNPGEIDYLIQHKGQVIPIEAKSGKAGSMKSLHQFMHDKKLELAVRCDANPPSLQNVSVKTTKGQSVQYRMLNIPPFLVHRLPELLDAC